MFPSGVTVALPVRFTAWGVIVAVMFRVGSSPDASDTPTLPVGVHVGAGVTVIGTRSYPYWESRSNCTSVGFGPGVVGSGAGTVGMTCISAVSSTGLRSGVGVGITYTSDRQKL